MGNIPDHPDQRTNRLFHLLAVPILIGAGFLSSAPGCGRTEIKPVELYAEDMCGFCRMAVSDHRCAAEIITVPGDVLKFDDIACMENYRTMNTKVKVAAVFVKNYENRTWLPLNSAVFAETDIATPMGSGKLAFADSTRLQAFLKEHASQGQH